MSHAGPHPWPLLGHIPQFLVDKLGFLSRCAARYGDVVRLHIGEPTLLLTGADDVRHVLTASPGTYLKTPRLTGPRGQRVSGKGMHTSSGAFHLRQRRLLQPLFQPSSVEQFADVMRERTDSHLSRWRDGLEVDLASEMERVALSIIIGATFGRRFHDEADRLARAITIRRAYLEYLQACVPPLPEAWPAPIAVRYRSALRVIDATIQRAVADGDAGGGLAALYRSLHYQDGAPMTPALVRDEILTLMSTGYETVGDALAWTLYLLSRHPQAEARVLDELTDASASASPFTRMVVEESMRLYPPTWIFVRMAACPDQLPDGTAIEPGTKIYLCPYVTHRLAKYFPEPGQFDPGRFHPEAKAARPRFSYFPFGGGQRVCIGEAFAMQEIMTVLATIVPRYRCELLHDRPVVARPGITLRPRDGVPVRLRRR